MNNDDANLQNPWQSRVQLQVVLTLSIHTCGYVVGEYALYVCV